MVRKRRPVVPEDSPDYTIEQAVELCKKLRISEEKAEFLKGRLDNMANQWWSIARKPTNQTPAGQVRQELAAIEAAAAKLFHLMRTASGGTWAAVSEGSGILSADRQKSSNEDVAGQERRLDYSDEGPNFASRPTKICEVPVPEDLHRLYAEVYALEGASHVASQLLDKPSAGRYGDLALVEWVHLAYSLIFSELGLKFTQNVDKDGEPITPASAFCVEAFRYIAPDTSKARIVKVMKEEIKERKKPLEEMRWNRWIYSKPKD